MPSEGQAMDAEDVGINAEAGNQVPLIGEAGRSRFPVLQEAALVVRGGRPLGWEARLQPCPSIKR